MAWGGKPMTPIVKRTKYGDTIFVAHPCQAAVPWFLGIDGIWLLTAHHRDPGKWVC
jgi:hypothetical protein